MRYLFLPICDSESRKSVITPDSRKTSDGNPYTFDIDYPISVTRMFAFRQWRFGKRGWLRPWVLSIISREPENGAEIIDEIERMSFGGWRPSPGSVYPLLDEMTQEGFIQKKEDGRYQLTEKGKQELEWPFGAPSPRRSSVETILQEMQDNVSYLEDLNRSNSQKLAPNKESIRQIAERLSQLANV
jgi:DNA-binding PadR family transcriptional regulator